MSKADFFNQLQERLKGLPYEERRNIIQIYEDLFRQAEESGKSEREVIESLGFVAVPMPERPVMQVESPNTGSSFKRTAENGVRTVVAAIALGIFNLMFVLMPLLLVACIIFTLSMTAVLFSFSSIWIILGTGIPSSVSMLLLEVFSTLALTGLGVLLGIGMWKLTIGFVRLVKRYVRMNLKLIRGE